MAKEPPIQSIALHPDAPEKPAPGEPCTGCGICCAAETCPLALLLFLRRRGPCPALIWQPEARCYRCGLIADPARFLIGVPSRWNGRIAAFCARRIALGKGCDSFAEIIPPVSSALSDKKQN